MRYHLSVDGVLWSKQDADFDFESFAIQCGIQNARVDRQRLHSGKTRLRINASTDNLQAAIQFRSKFEVMSLHVGTDGLAVSSNF